MAQGLLGFMDGSVVCVGADGITSIINRGDALTPLSLTYSPSLNAVVMNTFEGNVFLLRDSNKYWSAFACRCQVYDCGLVMHVYCCAKVIVLELALLLPVLRLAVNNLRVFIVPFVLWCVIRLFTCSAVCSTWCTAAIHTGHAFPFTCPQT